MIDLNTYLLTMVVLSMIFNLGLSLYGIFFKPNLAKKIIALTIFGDTANTMALIVGYRRWLSPLQPSRPPVLVNYAQATKESVQYFASIAVDPLPQALVLTAIVISLAVTLFLVFLALQIYRLYGTLDMREVRRLRG
ncbi:NADH-ubiquinone oxidoreductase, chain 4L [Staphylothermus marinus F1]|uniref:NADH-ubiquinone oxidoreductase, chain 4L n=1 Tax=Staphylothermus marinus (strain ATCC 43588 / DSM 3639 / JCM 9404 / F1) TaxID=399550 RepID=A3DKH9_STAMF|nr:Na+/H+ antiporter subunit C [Staphylothermus marinus]ABN69139.1 NADH-ubiquinone oxidoreductase, chain 4L [Staphylothermus marinus F1]